MSGTTQSEAISSRVKTNFFFFIPDVEYKKTKQQQQKKPTTVDFQLFCIPYGIEPLYFMELINNTISCFVLSCQFNGT